MSQKFRVLWFDDIPRNITEQSEDLEKIVKKFGYSELQLESVHIRKNYETYFTKKNNFDLILTDYHFHKILGTEIIQYARKSGTLTDIVLYSMDDGIIHDTDLRKNLGYSSLVYFSAGEKVLEFVKPLIRKIADKWNDIVFLRGYWISRTLDLENSIDELFKCYFKINDGQKKSVFDTLLTTSGSIRFSNKIDFVKKICSELKPELNKPDKIEGFMKPFNSIRNFRNHLAHCRKDPDDPNKLIVDGIPKGYTKKDFDDYNSDMLEAEARIIELIGKCNS